LRFRTSGLHLVCVDLSVVIPVRDEAGNVAPLLAEVRSVLEGRLAYEVIVVDDGSADGTAERLTELLAREPRLRVLRHARPSGQSAALATGVREARAAWVATLDGDCQNDPADIPRLLAARDAPKRLPNLQLVGGWRRRRYDGFAKRAASRLANAFRRRLLEDGAPDTGCGLKLFRRESFLALPQFDHMHRFLPALLRRNGGTVVFVEVSHRPRASGRSKYGIRDRLWVGIADTFGVLWLMRRASAPAFQELGRP
jgi:dolichol-phosphate mannosyltransferase